MNILDKITDKDLIQFATDLNVQDIGSLGDRLLPNTKTEYLEAEYIRLANTPSLPHAAMVHGFDTEAVIGTRPLAEVVRIEQLLIKEKLALTERVNRLRSRGVQSENAILNYIYDDLGNLAMAVRTRAEVAKIEALSTGKMHIAENGVTLEVDYGVPDANKYNLDWFAVDYDILGDIRKIINAGRMQGQRYNRAIISTTVLDILSSNLGIQKAVNGNINAGIMVTEDGINSLFNRLFGFTVEVNDDWYRYTKADGTETSARLLDEYRMVLFVADNSGAVGTGLWGVTPDELEAGGFDNTGFNGFIYLSQWTTPDPVARWSKASGVFVPVLPNPKGIVTINLRGSQKGLKKLDVNTTAGSTANTSVLDISPAKDSSNTGFAYKLGSDFINVDLDEEITVGSASGNWTAVPVDNTITVTGKKSQVITVVEYKSTTVDDTTTTVVKGVGYSVVNKA